MYNLDRYIADFLLTNKKLSAQSIGEFSIVDGQAVNGAPLVQFVSNKGALTTEELISFVAEQERKSKVVTGFDLESHFSQVKQFINIGTPWAIPGLGQLQFGKNRELEFVQQAQSENLLQERIKRKQAAPEATYNSYETGITASRKKTNTGAIVLTLAVILALGVGGYYFYENKNSIAPALPSTDTIASVTDTVISVPPSSNINNTVTNTQPPVANPGSDNTVTASSGIASGYRFILNSTVNPVYAKKRYAQLKSYGTKVSMDSVKKDSYSLYKIYFTMDVAPADTAKLRDSLTKYYGRPVRIEPAH